MYVSTFKLNVVTYIHTFSRFIPEGVAEVSQIFLQLAMRNTADVTGGKHIAVLLQSISGVSAVNPLVAFCDIHPFYDCIQTAQELQFAVGLQLKCGPYV
jgi:hypothetical protein